MKIVIFYLLLDFYNQRNLVKKSVLVLLLKLPKTQSAMILKWISVCHLPPYASPYFIRFSGNIALIQHRLLQYYQNISNPLNSLNFLTRYKCIINTFYNFVYCFLRDC